MGTAGQLSQKVERTAVGMRQRQERQRAAAAVEILVSRKGIVDAECEQDVARQVIDRQHDAFRRACRARGIVQQADRIVRNIGVFDILAAEAAGIGLAIVAHDIRHILGQRVAVALVDHMVVRKRKYGIHMRNLLLLDIVPEVIAQKEQLALRVVDDMYHVVGREVLQYGHYNGTVGYRCNVGYAPARIVAAYKRNLVAALYVGLAEQQMQFGDLLRHFVI